MSIRSRRGARRRRLVLTSAGVVLLLYVMSGLALFDQPHFGLTLHGDEVARTEPRGPADRAGIARGDRLLSLGEERVAGNPFLRERFYSGALGWTLDGEISGPHGIEPVHLEAEHKPLTARWQEAASLVTGVGFLIIGLYVAIQLESSLASLFFALSVGFSLVLLPIAPPEPRAASVAFAVARALAALAVPPLTLHFFLFFPRPRTFAGSHPALVKLLYAPAAAALVPFAYVCTAAALRPGAPGLDALTMGVERLAELTFLVYSVLALASFVVGTFRVRSAAERRRYSVVVWATVIGIAPLVLAVTIHTFWSHLWMPWERFTSVGLLVVPLGFAYAIVRHQLFDIEVIVKRSAAFSLLTACLVAIAVIVYAIFGRALESIAGRQTPWLMIVTLVVIAGLFSPLRRRIEGGVDRIFFPDRYDDRRVLRELAQSLPGRLKLSLLFEEVVEKLSRTLRAREAAIFMPEEQGASYEVVYASGLGIEDLELPPLPPRVLTLLSRGKRPLRVLDVEDDLPYGAFERDEERVFDVFAAGVLVPLMTGLDVSAVLVLGRRAGGETYGFEDMELLREIATQASLGLRNAEMHAREVEQERIARELSVAHEIQRQLLPSRSPLTPGFEFAGGTSPCHELGGDFYDYLELDERTVGVALGDVSGHGIPAALVMASLSGTLRSEALRERDPGYLLNRLNERACETMEPGQFLSLFYALIDLRDRRVTYANAGHPPPLVVEPGGKVLQLATGGLLLGIDARARYRSAVTEVRAGSTLLLFSDGLVEARRDEMEFGEERVIALVRRNGKRSAPAIRRDILEHARAFVAGDLEDDVTLIVIQVNDPAASF